MTEAADPIQISYVNQTGEATDWFFDGVLTLGLISPDGRDFGGGANLNDWKWYLDKTFDADDEMYQLNEATKELEPSWGSLAISCHDDPGYRGIPDRICSSILSKHMDPAKRPCIERRLNYMQMSSRQVSIVI
ncbi:DUF4855 domain-containing protein [Paenibacillus lautus]|jgi:hypothetical protein|uniref:DUF4855 domain-containing protein n=1 Tax=Paenibacillus lautus TaxID=1401 RepID=UPI003530EE37